MELAEHHMRTNVPQKAIPLLQQLLESQREEAGEGVRGALTEPVIHTLLLLGRAQAQMARLRAVQADPKARADAQSMPVADPVTAVPLRAGTAAERGAWFALRGVRPALRRARTTWQEALEALCRTQGPAAEETLGALDLVAGAEVEEGRFTNAFAHVQEWLHRVRREHGRRHEGVQLMRDMSRWGRKMPTIPLSAVPPCSCRAPVQLHTGRARAVLHATRGCTAGAACCCGGDGGGGQQGEG